MTKFQGHCAYLASPNPDYVNLAEFNALPYERQLVLVYD